METKKLMIIAVSALAVLVLMLGMFLSQAGDKDDAEKVSLDTVTVAAYNMSYLPYDGNDPRYYEDEKPISEYKTGDFKLKTVKGQEEILYITLEDFAALYKNDYQDGYYGVVTSDGKTSVWTIKDKDGKDVYHMSADPVSMVLKEGGDPVWAIKPYEIKNTLMEQLEFKLNVIKGGSDESVFSFKGYGLDPVTDGGKVYYPIGLLSMHAQNEIARKFIYSSQDHMLFEYGKNEQMDSTFIYGKYGNNACIKTIVGESFGRFSKEMHEEIVIDAPMYMREHTRNLFYCIMDNYYGLGSVIGYKNMGDYFRNTVYDKEFLSDDPQIRASAYGKALSLLNDGHTMFSGSALLGEATALFGNEYYQTLNKDRMALSSILTTQRNAELSKTGEDVRPVDVRYSSDGKTAYFSFDDFNVATYTKDPMPDEDRYADTYYLFIKNMNEIKDKGGVERVIVDVSVNGGGYVSIMGKILALMSKDNHASLYFRDDNSGSITEQSIRVDSNGDGVYDTKDCYGQYFKFYIVTSASSFSCGNALPFFALENGFAKVIGTNSGGGECTVDLVALPFGESIMHSSTNHAGYYDPETKVFTGAEAGAGISMVLSANMYNVDQLSEAIENNEKKPQVSLS
ncbi:MAG: hypothetical protein J5938_04615 [Clostridia bacterium]|nr:hypothetical protein [Clostridia bacterium]